MIDISSRLDIIRSLVDEDTIQSLTYAALECRLTLECICYERFGMYHSYLSKKDLEGWKPVHIVKQVANDIDERVSRGCKLEISKVVFESGCAPKTQEEFEACEYVEVGNQSPINLKRIDKFWNSLSRLGLHVSLDEIFDGELSPYGDKDSIKRKVLKIIEYLEGLDGNLLLGGVLEGTMNFRCLACDTEIRKPLDTPETAVVSCINPGCDESYHLKIVNGVVEATRRLWSTDCAHCSNRLEVPLSKFNYLRGNTKIVLNCGGCGEQSELVLMAMHVAKKQSENLENKVKT